MIAPARDSSARQDTACTDPCRAPLRHLQRFRHKADHFRVFPRRIEQRRPQRALLPQVRQKTVIAARSLQHQRQLRGIAGRKIAVVVPAQHAYVARNPAGQHGTPLVTASMITLAPPSITLEMIMACACAIRRRVSVCGRFSSQT